MTNKSDDLHPESTGPESDAAEQAELELEAEAAKERATDEAEVDAETELEAEDGPEPESEDNSDSEEDQPEFIPKPRPPAKLERLQKILAQAGVASRRSAEAMIEQGRVQVNGKVVTELGTKADAGRDHIRVDGKLLQGAERLRYFILNKPRGFVTTVKDPEGRPTVMQFFEKMKERLYPVGRLDYMSEGLLLVTNDGELANRLTKASSGVEKTYLVKVAGQPTESELDILRAGVAIERGKPGEGRVRTSPARIRQVRQGDNPWYEVVLIEGRNRELRKMFEEIGHFVEKIRRVGYGPLVLDQEPGNLRELEPEELVQLRLAAEGKLRTPKSKDIRRRNLMDAGKLPTVLPKASSRPRAAQPSESSPVPQRPGTERPVTGRSATPGRPGEFKPRKPFSPSDRSSRAAGAAASKLGPPRSASRPPERGPAGPDARPPVGRPAWKKDDRAARPPARFAADSTGGGRQRTSSAGPGRTGGTRPFTSKPTWKKPERQQWPAYQRPPAPSRRVPEEDLGPSRPPNLQIEEIPARQPGTAGPSTPRSSRPGAPRPFVDRSSEARPRPDRPPTEGPTPSRSSSARPFRAEGGLARPFTTSSGKPRPGGARPSSKPGRPGKPPTRSYGAGAPRGGPRTGPDSRPSFGAKRPYDAKPTGHSSAPPAKRPFRGETGEGSYSPRPPRPAAGSGSRPARPYTPRPEGASDYRPTKAKPYPKSAPRSERKAGAGWKPKPSFGGPGKPASGARSKPKPGGFSKSSGPSKSGYKGKPTGSGAKRSGPRPSGKRPGGAPGGKKRG